MDPTQHCNTFYGQTYLNILQYKSTYIKGLCVLHFGTSYKHVVWYSIIQSIFISANAKYSGFSLVLANKFATVKISIKRWSTHHHIHPYLKTISTAKDVAELNARLLCHPISRMIAFPSVLPLFLVLLCFPSVPLTEATTPPSSPKQADPAQAHM